MSQPLIIYKTPSGWSVYVNVAAARRAAPRRVVERGGRPFNLPDYPLAAVVRTKTGLDLKPGGKAHVFKTKGEAEGTAHKVLRYMLDMGDMVHAHAEYRDKRRGRDLPESIGSHGYEPSRQLSDREKARRAAERRRRYHATTQAQGEQGPGYDQRRPRRKRKRTRRAQR